MAPPRSTAPEPIALPSGRQDVRMDGVSFFRTAMLGPFARRLEPGNFSYCVGVRAGRLTLETDFPVYRTIELVTGDMVAVSGLASNLFSSLPPAAEIMPSAFERLALPGPRLDQGVELIIGVAPSDSLALGSWAAGPMLIRSDAHPDASRRLWRAVEMLEDEYAETRSLHRDLVIRRLAEIMAVNFTRGAFADRQANGAPEAHPAVDRQITQAINAVLQAPDHPWTLDGLAKAAAMSRTRFAEAFKQVTGQTPGHIITRLRLTAIARRLASDALSVEAAAEEAGYSTAAAFVRAFQREFGDTPARWRKRRQTPAASAPPASRSQRAVKRGRRT